MANLIFGDRKYAPPIKGPIISAIGLLIRFETCGRDLKTMWDEFDMTEDDIDLLLNPPIDLIDNQIKETQSMHHKFRIDYQKSFFNDAPFIERKILLIGAEIAELKIKWLEKVKNG